MTQRSAITRAVLAVATLVVSPSLVAIVPFGWLVRQPGPSWGWMTRGAGYAGGVLAAFWAYERGAALF